MTYLPPRESVWQLVESRSGIIAAFLLGAVLGLSGIWVYQLSRPTKSEIRFISGVEEPAAGEIGEEGHRLSDTVGEPASLAGRPSVATVTIDVAGAVASPGVYSLPEGSRIGEAIDAAGGVAADADVVYISQSLNLAQRLSDGAKVYIPFTSEVGAGAVAGVATDFSGTGSGAAAVVGKVNINQASLTELESLPGIGPALAGRIIDYRKTNGSFDRLEDICSVSGIGIKTLETIRDLITI